MAVEVGTTVEGVVVRLADYGAIVRLQGGKTGLIHISEIADTYVRDVHDYFKEQDRVRVRVLSVNTKGRYELSTKQIEQPVIEPPAPREKRKPIIKRAPEPVYLGPDALHEEPARHGLPATFEDRLASFIKDSSDRQSDVRRNIDAKRGVRKR